jgi:subtilisin-like proprotein convertase family protein
MSRRRKRTGQRHFQHEALEQRLALAVSVLELDSFVTSGPAAPGGGPPTAITRPGYVMILGSQGEDVFIQQTATSPQSLLVADNPSFLNGLFVRDVDARFDKIVATSGEFRSDSDVQQDNDAVYDFLGASVTTRFVVPVNDANALPTVPFGTLRLRQSDGIVTEWRIGQVGAGVGIVSGSINPASYPAGYIIPSNTLVEVWNPWIANAASSRDRVSLIVSWRVSTSGGIGDRSPFPSAPIFDADFYGAIRPSSRLSATFTLPNALGNGSNGIVSGSMSGTVSFDGGTFAFRTEDYNSDVLVFSGGSLSPGFEPELVTPTTSSTGAGPFYHTVTGVVDRRQGSVTLNFQGAPALGGGSISPQRYPQDPGPVRLNATYGVTLQGNGVDGNPGSVTFFAGQNITREIYVDLPTPGATVNVNSPLIMSPTLASGDTALRATNVNIAATMLVNDRLDIGQSLMPTIETDNTIAFGEITENRFNRTGNAVRTAGAVAEIIGGQVVRLYTPAGLFGAGYDNDDPPVVTIAGPNGETNATLGAVTVDRNPASPTFGQVTAIAITAAGAGYDNTAPFTSAQPLITIAPPAGGVGTQATAVAVLDGQGRVVGVTIVNGGDYRSVADPVATIAQPQATAEAIIDDFGRVSGYVVTSPGFGYTTRPAVTVAAPEEIAGAEAVIAGLDANGRISGVTLTESGYGYLAPPQVWIAPPPKETGGIQAKARAVLDVVGRVERIEIIDAGSGYDPVSLPVIEIRGPIPLGSVETVNLDSSIAASIFDIRIADEVATQDVLRGSLNVSPSGSIAGEVFAGKAAASVFLLAQTADVNIEGTIWADSQSYLMQSTERDSELAPFRLTTAARATGISTGLIKGRNVAVTLANDAPTPGPFPAGGDDAIAFNILSLRTDIDSLRIRASTRDGVELREPFPYELSVTEANSFSVDAVAASSFPIAISAAQNMLFTATLATANDITLEAGENFTVSAPVSTTLGRISVVGDNVSVLNSLSVTAAAQDETRDDISLNAGAGVMTVGGALTAVNNVNLVQRNRTEPLVSSYSNPTVLPIPNNATVTQSIVISDTFAFDDIDVQVDITHPRVSDLTGTLIAPSGARYVLFARPGLAGPAAANMTGTVFDTEAANPLSAGVAPYTGRFRPADSLAPLYGDSVVGTWRLEISDVAPLQAGTLDNFQLFFTSRGGQQGGITGAARIVSDRLSIDAEGYVGNPLVLPTNPQFYLQTDVNALEARTGASLAIDEITDLEVTSIRAGGLVSLRARGVDPVAMGPDHVAALRGDLIDVPQIDVNAPNGSIDIRNNAPKTITVGNAEALRRGGAVSMRAAGNVTIRSTGGASFGELFVLDAPIAGEGARAVRSLVTSLPAYSYAPGVPGVRASTLTASANGLLTVSGLAALRQGDRLLVNLGSDQANGVYRVTAVGGSGSRWVLTRAADSDTAAETPSNTFVRVTDGPASGKVYQLTYSPTPTVPFTRTPIAVTETTVVTNIGSDDARDKTTFVVSTAAGTNSSAGSLGKMLRLLQVNDTSSSANPGQLMDFAFSSQVLTPIRLTEQLPSITRSIAIDGEVTYNPPGSPAVIRPRIFVDGSRIIRNRQGNAITPGTVVHGFEFDGNAASSGKIANLTVAGFTTGAAVRINNANDILVDKMTLGTSELGLRVTNAYGVLVSGSSAGATVSGSTVTASTKAGVRLEGTVTNSVLVGNPIGVGDRDNNVGVEIDTTGTNRIGVLPITPAAAIPPATAARVTDSTFTLPAGYTADAGRLFVGLGVRGSGITVTTGAPVATIGALTTNPTTGVTTVTIVGGRVTASGSVTFGNFVATTANTVELTLPATVKAESLYVGQIVRGGSNSGIPSTARVAAIAVNGSGIVTITLSSALTATGVTTVTFGAPPRNTVLGNLTGIVLSNGMTAVNNTTISTNTFDGIRITGGTNTIGSTTTRSDASNVIVGNGGFGIVSATTGLRTAAETIAQRQTIRGNYLGVTPTDNGVGRRNAKGNVGLSFRAPSVVDVVYAGLANQYAPDAFTLVDAEGNQHSGTPATRDPSPTTPRPGTPGRRGVPPLPPRRR